MDINQKLEALIDGGFGPEQWASDVKNIINEEIESAFSFFKTDLTRMGLVETKVKDLNSHYKGLFSQDGKREPLQQMEGESDEDFEMWQEVERELEAEAEEELVITKDMKRKYDAIADDYTPEAELRERILSILKEGTWSTSEDNPTAVIEFFSQPRLLQDVDSWIDLVYEFAGNDALFNQIEDLKRKPDFATFDIRESILDYLIDIESEHLNNEKTIASIKKLMSRSPLRESNNNQKFKEMGRKIADRYMELILEEAAKSVKRSTSFNRLNTNDWGDEFGPASYTEEEEIVEEEDDAIFSYAFDLADAFLEGFSENWIIPVNDL